MEYLTEQRILNGKCSNIQKISKGMFNFLSYQIFKWVVDSETRDIFSKKRNGREFLGQESDLSIGKVNGVFILGMQMAVWAAF